MRKNERKRKSTLRTVPLESGLPHVDDLADELQEMTDVLLGRVEPPVNVGILGLQEVADAYFGRACEISSLIHRATREGNIERSSEYNKFRTGELRDFLEMSKRAAELGSRRLSEAQHLYDLEQTGRESS